MTLYLMKKWNELQERRPTMERAWVATRESMARLQDWFQEPGFAIELEDLPDWTSIMVRLSDLCFEFQDFSRTSLVLMSIVSLKAVRVFSNALDALLTQIVIKPQALMPEVTRMLLAISSLSGWVSLYWYRAIIMKDMKDALASRPLRSLPPGAAMKNGDQAALPEAGVVWSVQLVRNLKLLPRQFWLSLATSCLVSLHVADHQGRDFLRLLIRRAGAKGLIRTFYQALGVYICGVMCVGLWDSMKLKRGRSKNHSAKALEGSNSHCSSSQGHNSSESSSNAAAAAAN